MRKLLIFQLPALFALIGTGSSAHATEYNYVMIFGSQSHPKLLRYTHTWATFVKAVGEGPDLNTYQLYVHTISWLPATLDVRVWTRAPEKGVNLPLEQTLAVVYNNKESVTMWGPFLIQPLLYDRSLKVYEILNAGAVQYRAIDGAADIMISDCIHAVAAIDPVFGRTHYPLIRIGKPASRYMAREVVTRSREKGIDQSCFDNSWLIPRLGLNRYPIEIIAPGEIKPRW